MSFLTPAVKEFVKNNTDADVRKLAFCKTGLSSTEMKTALQQIDGRQKAKGKLPTWAANEEIAYPAHLSLEQCSSEQTAAYKQSALQEGGRMMADLTGGFGIDFAYLSSRFETAHYVELNADLCAIAENNFPTLGLNNAHIHNTDAESFLAAHKNEHFDLLFADPARRDANGRKTVAPSDCLPDLTRLQHQMAGMTRQTLVKYSPMLDIATALKELLNVRAIYVVSVNNECKELLLLQDFAQTADDVELVCADMKNGATNEFRTSLAKEKAAILPLANTLGRYLYEPNAAIMKAGAYKSIAAAWQVQALQQNSHLYTSEELRPDFQGRAFEITGTCKISRDDFQRVFPGTKQANITIRNCPLKQEDIRKKLKLKEGGDLYLFATTLMNKEMVIIGCKKVK